jgi:hypothetical protein
MGTDVFTRGALVMSRRWRMRVVLAALVVEVVVWSYVGTLYLAVGALVLLLLLLVLGRRSQPLPTPPQLPPWVPPWQARTSHIDHRRLQVVAPAMRRRRRLWAVSLWSALGMGIRRWPRVGAAAVATLMAAPAWLRGHASHVSHILAALPSRLSRPNALTPTAMPAAIRALTALLDRTLAELGIAGQVATIEQTARGLTLCLQTHELNPTHMHAIRTTLRTHAPTARWTPNQRIRVPLPVAAPLDASCASPCVPILRRGRVTLWWPLREMRPLILVGDLVPVLLTLEDSLESLPRLLVYDPEQSLTQASAGTRWPSHTPDALAIASTHAHFTAFCRAQTPDRTPPAPLTLLVVAPDMAAWRVLTPLLTGLSGGVRLIVALTRGANHPAAQDACHFGHIVEIGASGREVLPEACRPPGLVPPRPGTILAWQTPQRFWRGTLIRRNPR